MIFPGVVLSVCDLFLSHSSTDHFQKPASEENDISDAAASLSEIPPVLHDASLIEDQYSPLLPAVHTALKHPPLHSQQCDALAVPLPLSPVLSSLRNGFMVDTSHISDTLNKDSLIRFPVSSDDDFKSRHLPETPLPSLVEPPPGVSHTSRRPIRPLFYEGDGPERIFSRSAIPTLSSPHLSPQSRPTSPRFWKSACSSPVGWAARPLSPSYYRFNNLSSDRWDSISCPTSPILRPSKPLPTPTSPTACHAMFSTVSRRLRALSSTSRISPIPSRPISPMSRPTSPVLQAFNIDNWVLGRDPTEDIDVIEIMVTREISVRIEETV